MLQHGIKIAGLGTLIATCAIMPFFPGKYDGMAMTLAMMAQLFGYSGLLLIPVGVTWLSFELKELWSSGARRHSKMRFYFAIVAIALSLFVAAITSLGALTIGMTAVGICLIAILAFFIWRVLPWLRKLKGDDFAGFSAIPLYLVVLPAIAFAITYKFGERAAELGRNRAIAHCEPMIADIEKYQKTHGRYPESLDSVNGDYEPGVIGVERFHYEPNGEAYNVYFEQFSYSLGTEEFVMYNRRDEHDMTSHNMHLLQMPSLESSYRPHGFYAVEDVGKPHWRRFLFD